MEPLTKGQILDQTAEILPSTPRLIETVPNPHPLSLFSRASTAGAKKIEKEEAEEETNIEREEGLRGKVIEELELRLGIGFRVKHGASEYSERSPKRTVPSPG